MITLFQNNEKIFLINNILQASDHSYSFLQNPFWLLTVSLLISALVCIHLSANYRIQQSELIEQLRIKISSDLHDEVGSILSGLAMQSEIMEATANQLQKEKLQRLATMSRQALASMRDTVWALDARKDNWQSLMDRLYDHANETLSVKDIAFKVELTGINLKETLPLDIRQNLYLIAKEAITNTAKYSNGNQMCIQICQTNDGLSVRICDNGQVESTKVRTSGLGLSNMEMRAKQMGATFSINTNRGFAIAIAA